MKRLTLAVICATLISLSAGATTVERLSLDDMVRKAQSIVQGKVRATRTYWSANGKLILTTYTIDVAENIKGQPDKSVEVTTIGGTIGDITFHVAGMPAFEKDEDAVVFVERSGSFSTVVGLNQGKFSVRNGEVSNNVSNLSFPDGRDGIPVRMRLDDFKRQIRNRIR